MLKNPKRCGSSILARQNRILVSQIYLKDICLRNLSDQPSIFFKGHGVKRSLVCSSEILKRVPMPRHSELPPALTKAWFFLVVPNETSLKEFPMGTAHPPQVGEGQLSLIGHKTEQRFNILICARLILKLALFGPVVAASLCFGLQIIGP